MNLLHYIPSSGMNQMSELTHKDTHEEVNKDYHYWIWCISYNLLYGLQWIRNIIWTFTLQLLSYSSPLCIFQYLQLVTWKEDFASTLIYFVGSLCLGGNVFPIALLLSLLEEYSSTLLSSMVSNNYISVHYNNNELFLFYVCMHTLISLIY